MSRCRPVKHEDWEEMDNITKNIVQEIIRECNIFKVKIDERFCGYYVKLLTMDPKWKISPDIKLNRENIQILVSHCIKKIELYPCPSLKTMRMQHHFLTHLLDKMQMVEIFRKRLQNSLAPLEEDIMKFDLHEGHKGQENRLVRRIVLYCTCISGVGNPKNQVVLKDVNTVFKTMCDESELLEFARLAPTEKAEKLNLFQQIITGIRLFNRDCGKPAADVEDLPKLLTKAIQITQMTLQNELVKVMEKVNIATSAVEQFYVLSKNHEEIYELKLILPSYVTIGMYDYVADFLIYARQHEFYIKRMMNDVSEIEDYVRELVSRLHKVFSQLHTIVKYKVAIPTTVVYPLFEQLSVIWTKLQDETIILTSINSVYNNLFKDLEDEPINYEILKRFVKPNQILSDKQRMERTAGLKISRENTKCTVLEYTHIKDYYKLPLQYLGFCVWTMVETDGTLIMGNPEMGVCKWKDKYYVFAYKEGAEEFGKQPDVYINRVLTIVRNKPELINLLGLYEKICMVREIKTLYKKPKEKIETNEVEIQTEVHPIESYIDPLYSWNMWEHYKRAIKLTNISNCLTKSTQTIKSNYRQPVRIATINPKEKMVQTKRDAYQNTATPSNFIFGLRGRKDTNQHIIDLQIPVDEKKYQTCANAMDNPPVIKLDLEKCRYQKKFPTQPTKPKPEKQYNSFATKSCPTVLGRPVCLENLDDFLSAIQFDMDSYLEHFHCHEDCRPEYKCNCDSTNMSTQTF